MSTFDSIRTSLRTISSRIDAAGPVISWGLLAAAAAATAWGGLTMVIPNQGLKAQMDERLSRQQEIIKALREEGSRLDDQIRAMESPYQVAIIARRLGFQPAEPAATTVSNQRKR